MQNFALFWLIAVVLILAIEGCTMSLVSVWFLPGALVAMILALLRVPLPWQILCFVALSVVTLVFGRKIFRPFGKKEKTNVDALIGKTAVVTEEINNVYSHGAAKLGANEWAARAENEQDVILPGELVTVVAIEGVKLICRKRDGEEK